MYANRDHANRPDPIRASDHARARYMAKKEQRARYVARRNAWIVRALLLAVAALLLAELFVRAALPAPDNATFRVVQTFAGEEYVIDSGNSAADCAARAARSTVIHCERE